MDRKKCFRKVRAYSVVKVWDSLSLSGSEIANINETRSDASSALLRFGELSYYDEANSCKTVPVEVTPYTVPLTFKPTFVGFIKQTSTCMLLESINLKIIKYKGEMNMHATSNPLQLNLCEKLAYTTEELMSALSCGRGTAIEIGTQACGKISVGRRVLWNKNKIQEYLNTISTN